LVKISFLLLFLNEGLHYILPIRYAVCDNPVACYHLFARNCLRRWVFDRTSELSHKVVLLLFVWRIRLCVLDEPGVWKGRGERRRERESKRKRVRTRQNDAPREQTEGERGRDRKRESESSAETAWVLEGGGRTRNRGESEEKERVTESKRGRILTQMKAIEASSRRQVARFGSMLDTARQTWNPGDLSCHQAHMSNISQQARTHGCMTGRSTAQNTARRNVPRPLPLYSMHEQLSQRARSSCEEMRAVLFRPCKSCTKALPKAELGSQPVSGPSPSPSGAGVAATRTCGRIPGLSTARGSCKPRLQWSSPRPRWTAATRARDGRSPGS